jgi:hypothetical protein
MPITPPISFPRLQCLLLKLSNCQLDSDCLIAQRLFHFQIEFRIPLASFHVQWLVFAKQSHSGSLERIRKSLNVGGLWKFGLRLIRYFVIHAMQKRFREEATDPPTGTDHPSVKKGGHCPGAGPSHPPATVALLAARGAAVVFFYLAGNADLTPIEL